MPGGDVAGGDVAGGDVAGGGGIRQRRFRPPPGATRVLLVRHGESAPAHPDRPFPLRDGHGDPELHPEGRRQAELVGARLAATEDVAAIYVSTLRRTHQTAAPLVRRLGLEPVELADLREVHLGEWEGGALRLRAAEGHPLYQRILAEQRWDVIPGSEPLEDFDERLQRGLAGIVAAHPDETVVAFVHGGVVGQLLARAASSSGFAFATADNASISELVATEGRHLIRRFNDCAHLD